MRTLLFGLILVLMTVTMAGARPMVTLYVAADGRDSWSGRLAAPSKSGSDGPLATLAGARDHLRTLRAQSKTPGPAMVLVRRGTYFLGEPLLLTPQDSDTTWAAYRGEHPVISGGRRITDWRQGANGLWEASAPGADFKGLFVGDAARERTRLPKRGFFTIADAVPSTQPDKGYDRFQFAPGDLQADWRNPGDVEVCAIHTWSMSRLRIQSVDEASHVVTFTGPTFTKEAYGALPRGNRYWVENVFEALPDEPGAWYLDRPAGVVYYHPQSGEDIATFAPVASHLEQLVRLEGDPAQKQWVSRITFRGLSFRHTDWPLPPQGRSFPQAEADLGGAVGAAGARDCRWEDCEVTQVGTYALELGRGCQRDQILRCRLHGLGAGGVKIGETQIRPDPDDMARDNVVQDCRIYDGGRAHPAGIGVWIGQSPGNRVVHNDIHDLYYTGVSLGWTWGYGPSLAQNNLVAYNRIYNIGRGLLSDMGGIYTLGNEAGTRLTHNLIHDVNSFSYGGWGIYPDEGTTGMLVEDNVVYRTKTGGFHQHYGKDNLVQNNVFALNTEAQLQRTRAEDHVSFTFRHNIVSWDTGELLNGNWTGGQFVMDGNLYWHGGRPFTFGKGTLAEWQQGGHDQHSVIGDPLFVNPAAGDFRLKPGSPAVGLGFRAIDLAGVGVRSAETTWPAKN